MREYDVGDLVKVTGTFTDPDDSDAAIDPTTVKLRVKDPNGEVTVYVYDGVDGDASEDGRIWRSAAGVYHFNIDTAADEISGDEKEGIWRYRWYSRGDGKAADEDYFKTVTDFSLGTGT